MIDKVRWSFLLLMAMFVFPSSGFAQGSERNEKAWAFFKAWHSFRLDVDSTLPGSHGKIYLVENLTEMPAWMVRDGLRVSRSRKSLAFFAQRASNAGDRQAIPALLQAHRSTPDKATKHRVECALVRLGDEETLEDLSQKLTNGGPEVKRDAAIALLAGNRKSRTLLTRALTNDDIHLKIAAASALIRQGHEKSRRILRKFSSSTNSFHRIEAAHTLALSGDNHALGLLKGKLIHSKTDRIRLIRSISWAGGKAEQKILQDMLSSLPEERFQRLRFELLAGLGRITLRGQFKSSEYPRNKLDAYRPLSDFPQSWLISVGSSVYQGKGTRENLLKIAKMAEPHRNENAENKVPDDVLLKRLNLKRQNDPENRIRRFDAAVVLLERYAGQLEYQNYADPPVVSPVGIGSERAFDGNFATAWIAGSMAGPLRIDLPQITTIRNLSVIGGCTDSGDSYREHARIKQLRIETKQGQVRYSELEDGNPYFQRVDLNGVRTDRITIEVTETYRGTRAKAPACISEIRINSET